MDYVCQVHGYGGVCRVHTDAGKDFLAQAEGEHAPIGGGGADVFMGKEAELV